MAFIYQISQNLKTQVYQVMLQLKNDNPIKEPKKSYIIQDTKHHYTSEQCLALTKKTITSEKCTLYIPSLISTSSLTENSHPSGKLVKMARAQKKDPIHNQR